MLCMTFLLQQVFFSVEYKIWRLKRFSFTCAYIYALNSHKYVIIMSNKQEDRQEKDRAVFEWALSWCRESEGASRKFGRFHKDLFSSVQEISDILRKRMKSESLLLQVCAYTISLSLSLFKCVCLIPLYSVGRRETENEKKRKRELKSSFWSFWGVVARRGKVVFLKEQSPSFFEVSKKKNSFLTLSSILWTSWVNWKNPWVKLNIFVHSCEISRERRPFVCEKAKS